MPLLAWRCPACQRTLGTLRRYQDGRGRPMARLRLNRNVDHVGRRWWHRYAECVCGERVNLPEDTAVEFD